MGTADVKGIKTIQDATMPWEEHARVFHISDTLYQRLNSIAKDAQAASHQSEAKIMDRVIGRKSGFQNERT